MVATPHSVDSAMQKLRCATPSLVPLTVAGRAGAAGVAAPFRAAWARRRAPATAITQCHSTEVTIAAVTQVRMPAAMNMHAPAHLARTRVVITASTALQANSRTTLNIMKANAKCTPSAPQHSTRLMHPLHMSIEFVHPALPAIVATDQPTQHLAVLARSRRLLLAHARIAAQRHGSRIRVNLLA